MPSATGAKDERPRADLVIGDRYGTSCVAIVAETIEETMRGFGYVVSRNKPYAGGFITEHYGNPAAGLHAIQLEINRALYMDERHYERAASFARLAGEFEFVADRLSEFHWKSCGPTGRRRNDGLCRPRAAAADRKKKGRRQPPAAQVSEETPRRATVTQKITTLPHCNNIHRAAQKSRPADHFPLILPANGAELCLPVRMTVTDTGGSQKTEECQ